MARRRAFHSLRLPPRLALADLPWRRPPDQARRLRAPVKATRRVRTRTPLMGSTSPDGEVDRVDQSNWLLARDLDTLSQPPPTRLVTVMGRRLLLLAVFRRHARCRRVTSRRCLLPISAANWLSREPAGTLRAQVRGLRPWPAAAALHLGSGATPNVLAWPSTATSARRKRRCRP
jgi:hypothetical protein